MIICFNAACLKEVWYLLWLLSLSLSSEITFIVLFESKIDQHWVSPEDLQAKMESVHLYSKNSLRSKFYTAGLIFFTMWICKIQYCQFIKEHFSKMSNSKINAIISLKWTIYSCHFVVTCVPSSLTLSNFFRIQLSI